MLTPNEIPRKEPKVRIGIILPTDSIKTLRCSFSDPQCYEIETSTKILPSCKNEKEFNIQISDRNIVIPELSLKDKNIKLIPSILDENPFVKQGLANVIVSIFVMIAVSVLKSKGYI